MCVGVCGSAGELNSGEQIGVDLELEIPEKLEAHGQCHNMAHSEVGTVGEMSFTT